MSLEINRAVPPADERSRFRPADAPARRTPTLPLALPGADLSPEHGSQSLWRLLKRAATLACEEMEREGGADGWSGFELEAGVVNLCAAVRQVVRGREPRLRALPMHVPMHRCLTALRRCFLEQSQKTNVHLDQDTLLAVLLAFERVQDALDRDCAQRLLSQLSGMDALDLVVEVAHDMRSPLGSILFLVETLRKAQSGPINAVQERQLGIVYNAAFGLSTLASDLTEMARGCERLFDMQPAPFSVAEVCRSVMGIVQPIAEEKGLGVVIRVPEMDFRVGHAAALSRVLLNLTTNALKFTSAGTVELDATQQGRTRLVFSVRDSGPGIPPEVLATLYDAFRRRRTPGQYAFSSAGLGLAICRKVVEGLGSELRVESSAGSGTRFSFTLDLPFASKL